MADNINDGTFTGFGKFRDRVTQRTILPTSIKPRLVDNNLLQNSSVTSGSFSIGNTVTVTLTITVTSNNNKSARLLIIPQLAFYQTTATTANLIPFGSGIATGRYTVTGPIAMPEVTGGTDGNNMVFKVSIANNSGSTQTILYYFEDRFIQSTGGGGVNS